MKVLVLGGDGYCGWPTSLHLSGVGYEVAIVDNLRPADHRPRAQHREPDPDLGHKGPGRGVARGERATRVEFDDLLDWEFVSDVVQRHQPELVHFAEQRAAPYSMIDRRHAVYTQHNNVIGNLQRALRHKRVSCPTATW